MYYMTCIEKLRALPHVQRYLPPSMHMHMPNSTEQGLKSTRVIIGIGIGLIDDQ